MLLINTLHLHTYLSKGCSFACLMEVIMECASKCELQPGPHPITRERSLPVPIGKIATAACNKYKWKLLHNK